MTPSIAGSVLRMFRQLAKDEKACQNRAFSCQPLSNRTHRNVVPFFECPDPDCHRPQVSLSDKRRHFQLHHLAHLLHRSRVSNAFS